MAASSTCTMLVLVVLVSVDYSAPGAAVRSWLVKLVSVSDARSHARPDDAAHRKRHPRMVRRRAPAAGGRAGGRGGGLRGYLRIPAADLLRRHRRGLRLRGPHVPPAWRGTHGAGGLHRHASRAMQIGRAHG